MVDYLRKRGSPFYPYPHRLTARIGTTRAATGNGRPVMDEQRPIRIPPLVAVTWRGEVERELEAIIDLRRITGRGNIRRRVRAAYRRLPPCRVCGKVAVHRRRFRAWCSDRCESTERDVLRIRRETRRRPTLAAPPLPTHEEWEEWFTEAEQAELDRAAHARHLARIALIAPQEA